MKSPYPPRIISVSRRTDIPALYGDWFIHRLNEGWAVYANPFNGRELRVSLRREHVLCFVFWSKNYAPFLSHLKEIKARGFPFYFNYTFTAYPSFIEPHSPEFNSSIENFKALVELSCPEHITWRYDPIVISTKTPQAWHLENFEKLAGALKGSVTRCTISFMQWYAKVKRRLAQKTENYLDPTEGQKIALAAQLKEIGEKNGITLMACSYPLLEKAGIEGAKCVDNHLIEKLYYPGGLNLKALKTRKECGCVESRDIGAYDTCTLGCIYCYANGPSLKAVETHRRHNPKAPGLGLQKKEDSKEKEIQPDLFD